MSEQLAELWDWFADTQCRRYSPLYEQVCRAVARSDDVLAMVEEAPPEGHMPTVLLAAVHYLVLSGLDHPLAAVYAGAPGGEVGPLFVDVCRTQHEAIRTILATRHTNTNEVGRSAVLGPALTEAAARVGAPIGLVDVGCSAGLNLLCDRYLLDYGAHGMTGPPEAPVRLACDVTSGTPPIADLLPRIATRIGLDRDPVHLADDADMRWQLACVWPDTGRLARSRTALDLARAADLQIVEGDAVDALPALLTSLPGACVPVVVTTWALAYLRSDRRTEFVDVLRDASADRPIAWISGEAAGVVHPLGDVAVPPDALGIDASVLGLVVFDRGDLDASVLGFVHPHGRSLAWLA